MEIPIVLLIIDVAIPVVFLAYEAYQRGRYQRGETATIVAGMILVCAGITFFLIERRITGLVGGACIGAFAAGMLAQISYTAGKDKRI